MNRTISDTPSADSLAEAGDIAKDILSPESYPPPDSMVGTILERARLHYVSAMNAQATGDSVRSALQFEEAISLLNQLSYCPGIEDNQDFDDLISAVIEDYESYIARIDSLGPDASIFALREKLNQVVEQDSLSASLPGVLPGNTEIPLGVNSLVEQNIAFFQGKGREHMERWLHRSGKYFPLMKRIMKEEGAPEELIYLSMIESGLNPSARSWARAVGMWQFMQGTGRLYGLDVSYWYDERRDFEKATRAAARHLVDLHEEFDDWYLALAAYNSGAGRVYRAVRKGKSTDFWAIRRYLPRETRNYVPQYVAVALIGLNPGAFGFEGIEAAKPIDFEIVAVDDCVDLDVLAECAGSDLETIRDLNPELVRWCTPSGLASYNLRVPPGSGGAFATAYASLPDEQKRNFVIHNVRKGETLGGIARKYSVSTALVQQTNGIKNPKRLSIGTELRIPVPRAAHAYAEAATSTSRDRTSVSRPRMKTAAEPSRSVSMVADTRNKTKLVYRVKKGDTLGHIAEWYDCRAADIRNWNNLSYGRPILPGQDLSIWVDETRAGEFSNVAKNTFALNEQRHRKSHNNEAAEDGRTTVDYTVRAGDSLERISARHEVTVEQLKRWNRLSSSLIRVGQKLVIYPDAANIPSNHPPGTTVAQSSADRSGATRYTVKKGDTLWDIARAHNVQERELRKWNNLRANMIYAGQELLIYGIGGSQ